MSLSDGTVAGLEGAARTIPGVDFARCVKKLVDVGTLNNAGNLEASPKKFKAVELTMYVAGENGAVNNVILNTVKEKVAEQLSAGETINIISATVQEINPKLKITFAGSAEGIQLSQNEDELISAIRNYVNGLAIGTGFTALDMVRDFANQNNWEALITAVEVTGQR